MEVILIPVKGLWLCTHVQFCFCFFLRTQAALHVSLNREPYL